MIKGMDFASDEQSHRMKLLQTADGANTRMNIVSDGRSLCFSLSDRQASVKRLQNFAEKCSKHLRQEGERQNETR